MEVQGEARGAKRVVLNFTGAYEGQTFYRDRPFTWLELSGMEGVDCYCSGEAEAALGERLRAIGPEGIHFLDSGNYHYASKLWTALVHEPFELLVFDHHSDMQRPAFGEFLTCGSWIRSALSENPYLRKVWLAGPPGQELQALSEEFGGRLAGLGGEEIERLREDGRLCEAWKSEGSGLPLYLSIDKDILAASFARTNWDQGVCSPDTLKKLTLHLPGGAGGSGRPLIGADICGELPDGGGEARRLNDRTNRELLEFAEALLGAGGRAERQLCD